LSTGMSLNMVKKVARFLSSSPPTNLPFPSIT
jgi:hypothetical protein